MATWGKRDFLLRKGFDLVPNDIDTSGYTTFIPRSQRNSVRLTSHPKHSAPERPPYTRLPEADELSNVYSLFYRYRAFPTRPNSYQHTAQY